MNRLQIICEQELLRRCFFFTQDTDECPARGLLAYVYFLFENDKRKAFVWATARGHVHMMQCLVAHGVNLDERAIELASYRGQVGAVCYLLSRGCAVPWGAIYLANKFGHVEIEQLLLAKYKQ